MPKPLTEVDCRFELAAVSKKADGRYTLQFNHVRGSNIPVVTNIAFSRELLALALGVQKEKLAEHYAWAQGHPGQCVIIPPGQAPVKSKILPPDLSRLPILPGNLLDPSARNAISDKMGIDATVPLGQYERFAKIRIPGEEKIRLDNYLG